MSSVSHARDAQQKADGRPSGSSADRRPRLPAVAVMRQAMRQVTELTGRQPDTVSAVEHTDDGWRLEVELVELERVPSTTNILATYEVALDADANVVGYRRLRRYFRNAAEGD